MPPRNERVSTAPAEADIIIPERAAPPADPVVARIVDGLPAFDADTAATNIQNYRRQAADAVIQIGRWLLHAHEHYRSGGGRGSEGEGFRAFCERVQISKTPAYNYMKIVRRLAETGLLEGGQTPLLQLPAGVTKLLTIIEMDPEDVRTLNDGGSIDGVGTLDEIERMTTAELRKSIRAAHDERDRAVQHARDLEDRTRNAEAAVSDLRRQAAEGKNAPNDIVSVVAPELTRILRVLKEVQNRPRTERYEASGRVFDMLDLIQQAAIRALIREEKNDLPLPEDFEFPTDRMD